MSQRDRCLGVTTARPGVVSVPGLVQLYTAIDGYTGKTEAETLAGNTSNAYIYIYIYTYIYI